MNYPLYGLSSRLDKSISTKPVEKFSINPFLMHQNIENGKYVMVFQNRCYTNEIYPGILRVNQDILKKKLNDWLRPSDRKYIKLINYNTNKSTFAFDVDKWINDGLKNCKPYLELGCFTKSYRLGVELPYLFRTMGMQMIYEKFICDKFKENLKKNEKLRKNIFSMVEDITNKVLGSSSISMFDCKYDKISNSIEVSLKPTFIAGVMAAATLIANQKKKTKRQDFDELVKKYGKFH